MSSSAPKISVCVPIYNNAAVVAQTLDTLVSQTGADFELVLVDNASTDGTTAILEDYARRYPKIVRLVKKKTTTPASVNWNDALAQGRGQYVALYHADDLYAPGMVARQASFLDANPQACAVFTETQVVNDALRPMGFIRPPYPPDKEMFDLCEVLRPLSLSGFNFLVCPTFMGRKERLLAPPRFDPAYRYAFDIAYYLRLLSSAPVGVIRESLHRYRRASAAGSVMLFTRVLTQNEIYPILDPYLQNHPDWFTPSERARYESYKTADWWSVAINARARNDLEREQEVWKAHYSLSLLLSVLPYPAQWPKAFMAFVYSIARRIGLGKAWANLVLRYRVYKQTGTWAKVPEFRAL